MRPIINSGIGVDHCSEYSLAVVVFRLSMTGNNKAPHHKTVTAKTNGCNDLVSSTRVPSFA
jgi:hypothetical protein